MAQAAATETKTTALSRVCQCGRRSKKPLSLRWHQCPRGVSAQRDLYSAYPAGFVHQGEDGRYQLERESGDARLAPGAGSLLRAASEPGRQNNQPARGRSGSHAKGVLAPRPHGPALQAEAEGQNVVPGQTRTRESLAQAEAMCPRTPTSLAVGGARTGRPHRRFHPLPFPWRAEVLHAVSPGGPSARRRTRSGPRDAARGSGSTRQPELRGDALERLQYQGDVRVQLDA